MLISNTDAPPPQSGTARKGISNATEVQECKFAPFLQRHCCEKLGVRHVLADVRRVHMEQATALIRALTELKLLEPIDISLGFDDGERLTLQGLYTVSRDSLRELDDADALRLFRGGHLQLAYTITGSLNQLAILAHVRNRRLAER